MLIFTAAVLLRTINFYSHITFLGDQGRDANIIYDIITFKHFTAIGPTTSIGGIFLGPFYYYFVAPFLILFNFNPFGLAFGVLITTLFLMLLAYILLKKEFKKNTLVLFIFLISFSAANIYLSRFSWNPNLLPAFSFFVLICLVYILKNKNYLVSFTLGALISAILQLHYLGALIIPGLMLVFVTYFIFSKLAKKILLIKESIAVSLGFTLVSLPLIIFDLKHNFLNSRNFLKMFMNGDINSTPSFINHINQQKDVVNSFFKHTLNFELNFTILAIALFLILFVGIYISLKKPNLLFISSLSSFYLFLFGFAFLNSPRHNHYYGPIYWIFFFILAYEFSYFKNKIIYLLLVIGLSTYLYFNFLNFKNYFLEGSQQIERSKKIANFISPKIGKNSYNVATWPIAFSEEPYTYFLKINNQIPLDRKKIEIGKQMIIFCETKVCPVINSPSWNISMFGKARVAKIWKIEGLKIYKLVHLKNEK